MSKSKIVKRIHIVFADEQISVVRYSGRAAGLKTMDAIMVRSVDVSEIMKVNDPKLIGPVASFIYHDIIKNTPIAIIHSGKEK